MFIDWNGDGTFDPLDLATSLAILEEEARENARDREDEDS